VQQSLNRRCFVDWRKPEVKVKISFQTRTFTRVDCLLIALNIGIQIDSTKVFEMGIFSLFLFHLFPMTLPKVKFSGRAIAQFISFDTFDLTNAI
jgi:hypothetical protein